jgi:hypothetical protein
MDTQVSFCHVKDGVAEQIKSQHGPRRGRKEGGIEKKREQGRRGEEKREEERR